jgi:hypothetical protein
MVEFQEKKGIMNMTSRTPLVVLMSVFAAFSACGRGGRRVEIPSSWVWNKDQSTISPESGSRHVFDGWTVRAGSFVAEEEIAKFILWRKTAGAVKLHVIYTLEGRPGQLIVNRRVHRAARLEPVLHPRTFVTDAELRAGMNLLEFRGGGKGRLTVRRITLDDPAPRAGHDLEPGDSVTVFLPPGRGSIEWRGSGELFVETRESVSGVFREARETLRTRFLSRSLRRAIAFAGPGTMTVAAVKGRFDVLGFAYEEDRPDPPSEPKLRPAGPPPVFILLADACQAKHLGVYGYPRATSPNIDAFARDAVVFENAYATASYTRSSVRSLLTGAFPERSPVGDLTPVSKSLPTIPEYLKTKGYRTSIFTSTVTISPAFGFAKGVDDYHQYLAGQADKSLTRRIDLDAFARWLERPGPLFSYIHFIEPHLPILPPPPFLDMFAGTKGGRPGGRLMALMEHATALRRAFTPAEVQEVVNDYDSTIAYVDSEIGRAIDRIRKAGLYDDSLIIVLADHGEAMYEHKAWGHSRNVFEETTRVPLVIKFPASLGLKGRVPKVVQLIDVFPTVADLFADRLPLPGRSLLAAVEGGAIDDTPAVAQSVADASQYGVRWRRWYYIVNLASGRQQVFDLDGDPRSEMKEGAAELKRFFLGMLLDWRTRTGVGGGPSESIDLKTLTPAEIEALKTLGYIR